MLLMLVMLDDGDDGGDLDHCSDHGALDETLAMLMMGSVVRMMTGRGDAARQCNCRAYGSDGGMIFFLP